MSQSKNCGERGNRKRSNCCCSPLMLIILLTSLCSPFLFITFAEAAQRSGAWSLSLVADGYTFDGEQHLQTMPVIGARVGYNLTRFLSVEGLFDYVHTWDTRNNDRSADVMRYGGDVLLHLLPGGSPLVPYVAAGYGAMTIDQSGSERRIFGIFDYGIGLKYFLTENMAVRGDLRHLLFRSQGEMLYNYEYVTGFIWHFGGVRPKVEASISPPETPPQALPEPSPAAEPPLQPVPSTEPAPGRYKYCVNLRIEFDIDRAEIRQEYHHEVAKVAEFLTANDTATALIEAHTDNVGTDTHNTELSRRRAESVVSYLVEKFGINPERLSAKGYGEKAPVADNATDEGKQNNRRLQAIIDCAITPEKIEPEESLCLSLQVGFETGKSEINQIYRQELARMAEYLRRYPSTTATIEGHTDNIGGYAYNMKLSQKRADAVVDYLVKEFGIDRSRLFAKGYGYTRRVAYNTTEEGRRKNRRINAVLDCVVVTGK